MLIASPCRACSCTHSDYTHFTFYCSARLHHYCNDWHGPKSHSQTSLRIQVSATVNFFHTVFFPLAFQNEKYTGFHLIGLVFLFFVVFLIGWSLFVVCVFCVCVCAQGPTFSTEILEEKKKQRYWTKNRLESSLFRPPNSTEAGLLLKARMN